MRGARVCNFVGCSGVSFGRPAMVPGSVVSECVCMCVCVYVRVCRPRVFAVRRLGPEGPSKIQEVTLMRPIHGNL